LEQPGSENPLTATCAYGREQFEKTTRTEQVKVVAVKVRAIPEPFPARSSALPAVFEPRYATFVKRCGAPGAIATIEDAAVIKGERDE
jgi:hypothetical protein